MASTRSAPQSRYALSLTAALASAAALVLAASCAGAPKSGSAGGGKPDAFTSVSRLAETEGSAPGVADIGPVPAAGKTLVVFYYMPGNASERVAKDLASLYSADLERVVEKRVRKGFFGFMGAGADATFGAATKIRPPERDPSAYDRVFVLSPVWSWNLAPPIRTWLRLFKGKLPEVAYGTVSGDTEPDKIVAQMTKEGGRAPFAFSGFSERDFLPENRAVYVAKIRRLAGL
ncbi:MAG: hypothetical protein Q8M76_19770 [Spirochaetaceae bacterium]|nr:hypothetical protein [Spirochaetaceae bacterium]